MVRKVILWVSVILMSFLIFSFSAKPGDESDNISEKATEKIVDIVETVSETDDVQSTTSLFNKTHKFVRKIAHFAEFALLAILVFLLGRSYNFSVGICVALALGYSLLFAVSDEVHQLFVENRRGRVLDVVIDFCGSLAGVGISCIFVKRKKKIKNITHC